MPEHEIYLHNWATTRAVTVQADGTRTWVDRPATAAESRQMLVDSFSVPASALDGAHILLASYTYEDYYGSAYVLFARGGTLYQVVGGHCSCMGLEDQWEPEETSVAALARRLAEGWIAADYADAFRSAVGALVGAKEASVA